MRDFIWTVMFCVFYAAAASRLAQFVQAFVTRTFTFQKSTRQSTQSMSDPYRSNPEAERDRERARADAAESELTQARDELARVQFERDTAVQQGSIRTLGSRLRTGGVFALGALTCFTAIHTPQIVHDLASYEAPARTVRHHPNGATHGTFLTMLTGLRVRQAHTCVTCCARPGVRLIAMGEFIFTVDEKDGVLHWFWSRRNGRIESVLEPTSGGESPAPAQDPTWCDFPGLPFDRALVALADPPPLFFVND